MARRRSAHVPAAALALALAAVAPAHADPAPDPKAEAQHHIDRATELHQQSRFRESLRELRAAYKLDPRPELLFALGQVHVKIGRCADAIMFYEGYLATKPPDGPAAAAREAIQICKSNPPPPEPERQPGPATAPQPAPAPAPAKPGPATAPRPAPVPGPATAPRPATAPAPAEPAPAPARPAPPPPAPTAKLPAPAPAAAPRAGTPWYRDALGLSLAGAGVAGGLASALLYGSARSDLDASEGAATYDASEGLVDDARRKRAFAAIAGIGGAALVGAGVVHMILVGRGDAARETPPVAVAPLRAGAALTFTGRF